MRSFLRIILVGVGIATSHPSRANDAVLNRYACVACHQAQQKAIGPSWKQISEKYRDGSKTSAQLAASIKGGGAGKWGPIPMPAQPQVSDADLQTLGAWILSYR